MKRIKERRDGGELPTRGDIQKVFTQMVDGAAPEGMHDGETLPFETDSLCDPGQGLSLDGQRSQWYARKDWGVAVVVARNNTDKPVRIDESRCGGRWVIGVAARPTHGCNRARRAKCISRYVSHRYRKWPKRAGHHCSGGKAMKISSVAVVLVVFATLTGCATHGCSGTACKRPDSTSRELVIWWPPDMRDGLDDQDHERDYTVVKLRD